MAYSTMTKLHKVPCGDFGAERGWFEAFGAMCVTLEHAQEEMYVMKW